VPEATDSRKERRRVNAPKKLVKPRVFLVANTTWVEECHRLPKAGLGVSSNRMQKSAITSE
jgi:hypothetical protein